MRLISATLAALLTASAATAQDTPRAAVDALFDAMRAGDGEAVRMVVSENASLSRIETDGSVRPSSFDDWANWVDTQNEGDADEQIFDVQVHQSGNLASVWAPFLLTYKGDLVGCGVNTFILAWDTDRWTITHGTDTQDGGDCTTFEERYRTAQQEAGGE